jgi:hypothetical protein
MTTAASTTAAAMAKLRAGIRRHRDRGQQCDRGEGNTNPEHDCISRLRPQPYITIEIARCSLTGVILTPSALLPIVARSKTS